MERLNCLRCAYRNGDNGDCTVTGEFCAAIPAVHCRLLQKYLDTGLTPEESRDAKIIIKFSFAGGTSTVERIRELLKADKEGRVVVLPCKDWLDIVFGEQILFWGIDAGYPENPIMEISVDDADRISWYDGWKTVFLKGTDDNGQAWEFAPDAIGKTVFLTREEAEAALRRSKNG